MERTAKLLQTIGCCVCFSTHALALYLLCARHEIANGILSALILWFGLAAATAFYVLQHSQKAKLFASVPKLHLSSHSQSALALLSLAIAVLAAALTIHGMATLTIYNVPLASITLLLALFYLLTLIAAFTEAKQ